MPRADTGAVLVAAGIGKRLGLGPKALLRLKGRWMLEWPLRALLESPSVAQVAIVVRPGSEDAMRRWLRRRGLHQRTKVVGGGKERQDSVRQGLQALDGHLKYALVHDAARPFLKRKLVEQCAATARQRGTVVVAVPVKDSIKRVSGGSATSIPREELLAAQTPQGGRLDWLLAAALAAHKSKKLYTDEAGLLEAAGRAVFAIAGYEENYKVTTQPDLDAAKNLAKTFFE
jgi:2-C-methyl-D-erythritol 4-phosphate cytidylyltransferase